jgi:hypothetical protein
LKITTFIFSENHHDLGAELACIALAVLSNPDFSVTEVTCSNQILDHGGLDSSIREIV